MNDHVLEKSFQNYAQLVKMLPTRPKDNDLLLLYGYYKQATLGNCTTMKPQGIFAEKEKRKWDAWNKMKDKESNEAMILYIEKVKSLQIE